ncbi:MAG: glycosyltransferase family 9 protein [Terrimicrobiaceae bacterium]|nr:glycosyltransferase family 9 protein [Terrimicrobiaceae bacterium]
MMTSALRALTNQNHHITLLCKPQTVALLAPSFPEVDFLTFDAPWTAFRRKYELWRWPWRRLFQIIWLLRNRSLDIGVSVRRDPRDHLLLWLTGARRRLGFAKLGSRIFLTKVVSAKRDHQHTVNDWLDLCREIVPDAPILPPRLNTAAYASSKIESAFANLASPVVALHCGARIAVRRWPTDYFRNLIERMRDQYDFSFVLIPDTDGYGRELESLADAVFVDISIAEMVNVIARSDLLICNDSAPGHIADAVGAPCIAIFGPTDPVRFRPYSTENLVVIRDICPYRPCFDYCKFPEPFCLTHLNADEIWPEVRDHIERLIDIGILPSNLPKNDC